MSTPTDTETKAPFDPLTFEAIKVGPTWRQGEDGDWVLPARTLGWGIAAWCATNLTNEDGDPWMFTGEQLRFLLWLYEVDERGRFAYSAAVLQRLKGWGKDPFAAAVCLAELIGPCRFSHWDKNGNPVGKENRTAWVQLAAVNYEQTKNTFLLFAALLPKATIRKYEMELGKEMIRAKTATRLIEAITSSHRANEGKRPSFVIRNETHHWVSSNGGHDMADVIKRNADKSKDGSARTLDITNAYQPGEDSVAERTRDAYDLYESGQAEFFGLLYDSLEAPPEATLDIEAIPHVLRKIRGDSVWLDVERMTLAMLNPLTPPSQSRRFWYNQIVADEETMVTPAEWDVLKVKDAKLRPGDEICLGFDGSKTEDATALIAIRLSDRCVFNIGIWEKKRGPNEPDNWQVDRTDVDARVAWTFKTYKVRAFFGDTTHWESYIDKWSEQYREVLLTKATPSVSLIGFDMSGHKEVISMTTERLYGTIRDGGIHHDGDLHLRNHVMNTKRRIGHYGLMFDKDRRDDKKRNDGYVAMLLAFMALNKYLESGKRPEKERSGRFWLQ